jgi:hypothetical protein
MAQRNLSGINNSRQSRKRRLTYAVVHAMIIDEPNISTLDLAVLSVLLRHANYRTFEGTDPPPKVATIAKEAHAGLNRTRATLHSLHERGFISPLSSLKGGRNATRWKICVKRFASKRGLMAWVRAGLSVSRGQASPTGPAEQRSFTAEVLHQAPRRARMLKLAASSGTNPEGSVRLVASERLQ